MYFLHRAEWSIVCLSADASAAFSLMAGHCWLSAPLLHFCWWYPLMPLLPSRLWQATADCLLMPLLHFRWRYPPMRHKQIPSAEMQQTVRWWLSAAAFLLLSLCCLTTRGVFHCIACLSADDYPLMPLLPSRWWLSAAAFPLMAIRCCLSPAKPLLPYYTGSLSLHRMPFRWYLCCLPADGRPLLTVRWNPGCLSVDGRPLLPFSC